MNDNVVLFWRRYLSTRFKHTYIQIKLRSSNLAQHLTSTYPSLNGNSIFITDYLYPDLERPVEKDTITMPRRQQ